MTKRSSYRISYSGDPLHLHALDGYETVIHLNSNQKKKTSYLAYGSLAETQIGDGIEELKTFHQKKGDWLFGYLSYDLKNQLENLQSQNPDRQHYPDLRFFQPEVVIQISEGFLEALYYPEHTSEAQIRTDVEALTDPRPESITELPGIQFTPGITKQEYLNAIDKLQQEIHYGNIYEANFCQEFYAQTALEDPLSVYHHLIALSPTPYSAYMHFHEHYLMCASPERFIHKKGDRLVSQPIKGTIGRSSNSREDQQLKKHLLESAKDRNENVMIVDLVRNDLARSCLPGSVQVEELFGIYSFPQVHQMISTISGKLKPELHGLDALKQAYPMGSMTGAPKIRAMELIEQYEHFKRGLYSGTIGYLNPAGDYDFNVIIRSLFYHRLTQTLSFAVGGAITMKSDAMSEYDETLLKAKAIFELFKTDVREYQLN